jgi:hypothetical protein
MSVNPSAPGGSEERIAKIGGGRWIRYALADRIATKLEELLLLPRTHRMPNLLIVRKTNNGNAGQPMSSVSTRRRRAMAKWLRASR